MKKPPSWPMAEKPDGTLTVLRKKPATEDDRTSGRLIKIDWQKRYGFIRAAQLSETGDYRDYFFHRDAMTDPDEDWERLAAGDRMSFVPEMTARGPRALKVKKEG